MAQSAVSQPNPAAAVRDWWLAHPTAEPIDEPPTASRLVGELVSQVLVDVALPGHGATWERFEVLAAVGECDVTIGRLAEAHLDAVAILAELGSRAVAPGELWGVWAAEPPTARVAAAEVPNDGWRVSGHKAWCSGAGACTHALVTAHAPDGPRLFAVDLGAAGVGSLDGTWKGVALTGADTQTVALQDVAAVAVGGPDSYVGRPGFWHGAAGVAAVWYGGARGVAGALTAAASRRSLDEHQLAHLGAIDVALGAARATLQEAAATIDADPSDRGGRADVVARRVRGVVESAASEVIDRVGRALGPAPLATDRRHARRVADLTVYLRQSHAERDLADLGRRVVEVGPRW